MTEKQLKSLRRADLLEMLLNLVKENDELREQLAVAKSELEDRAIKLEPVGSLAEAALTLNGVFESAQAACEQYLHNIILRSQNIDEFCSRKERETQEKCDLMLAKAKEEALAYIENAKRGALASDNADTVINVDSDSDAENCN